MWDGLFVYVSVWVYACVFLPPLPALRMDLNLIKTPLKFPECHGVVLPEAIMDTL